MPYTLTLRQRLQQWHQQGPPIQGRLWRESSKEPGTYFHDKPKKNYWEHTKLPSVQPPQHTSTATAKTGIPSGAAGAALEK